MAITTSAITSSFKKQLLGGVQNIANGGNTLKLALYTDTAVIGPSIASYTTTGQVGNSGDYTAGGKSLAGQTTSLSGTTAIADFADLSYLTATISAMGALIYNSTVGNKSIAVLDFSTVKTSTAGTFTIQFPNYTDTLAIIRLA